MDGYDGDYYEREGYQSERARWTPLTRMLLSGEMTQERQKELQLKEKFDRWMINEGYRRVYVSELRVIKMEGGGREATFRWDCLVDG